MRWDVLKRWETSLNAVSASSVSPWGSIFVIGVPENVSVETWFSVSRRYSVVSSAKGKGFWYINFVKGNSYPGIFEQTIFFINIVPEFILE